MNKTVLIVGGAGYIGSNMTAMLADNGYEPVVFDNLSKGHRTAIGQAQFVHGDLSDYKLLLETLHTYDIEAVMHFAASVVVPESVREPLKYYRNNVENAFKLIGVCLRFGVKAFVFSSSAAVYGVPEEVPVKEEAPLRPINPYGSSKVMVEQALEDCSRAYGLRYVSLRYFNVAGADPEARIGQASREPTHLITRALKAAAGKLPRIEIYGTDYPTPDGTCIRDYIHVEDLAEAHLLTLEYLLDGGRSRVYNCGYGRGHSVKEVIEEVKRVTGVDFSVVEGPRRPGDPPELVADPSRIKAELGWSPRYKDLGSIIETAWSWERRLEDVLRKA